MGYGVIGGSSARPGGNRMDRRRFLKLAGVGGGLVALGGAWGARRSLADTPSIPTVDRLVLTNVVDNVYDVFARGGKLAGITVQRTLLAGAGETPLLAEHGLAFHLESARGGERREILLDFGLTGRSLFNNYRALAVDPTRADALILSHGHADHYGALPELARSGEGRLRPGLTLYAGGEDSFCQRVVITADGGRIDQGQLARPEL